MKTVFVIGIYRHVWLLEREPKNTFALYVHRGVKTTGHIAATTHQPYVVCLKS
jgi:hypothetical protein